jgi:hypothetical protein
VSSKSVPEPNYTQAPNLFFDQMMAEIDTMSELKVTLAIIRKTFGWHKEKEGDFVSLSQLEELTGMNRQQVVAGCKAALFRGYVWREKRDGRNYFGLHVGGMTVIPPDRDGGMKNIPAAGMTSIPTKETEKEITPTGEASPPLERKNTGQKPEANEYYIALLHIELESRELTYIEKGGSPLTADYKKKLAGQLTAYRNKGARHGRILLALDRIRTEWKRKRLSLSEAWDDTQEAKVRHLHAVEDKPSKPGGGLPSLRDRLG